MPASYELGDNIEWSVVRRSEAIAAGHEASNYFVPDLDFLQENEAQIIDYVNAIDDWAIVAFDGGKV